jgi:hypothetical protein
MARTGMEQLIRRLRQMTETNESDYSIGDQTYWNDDHLQDVLDEHRERLDMVMLQPRSEQLSGSLVYLRYELPRSIKAIEGVTADDDTAFRVTDSIGAVVEQADYSLSERDLSVVFSEDQEGAARYWSGFAYDLQAAACQIWEIKAAHTWTAVNFSVDWQRFDREAMHKHCVDMAKIYRYSSGSSGGSGGSKTARLVRSDLAPSQKDRF